MVQGSVLLLCGVQALVVFLSVKTANAFVETFCDAPSIPSFQSYTCLNAFSREKLTTKECDTTRWNFSRRRFVASCLVTTTMATTTSSFLSHAHAADDDAVVNSIVPCKKDPNGSPANCVSTSSVRQVDLYVAPWTWTEDTSVEEVVGRLKGAIASDSSLSMTQNIDNRYFRVRATRNFAVDEIQFLVNEADRVITLRSEQIEGPDVTDLGMNRKRLDEIRKRTQVLRVMGEEFSSADSAPREGAVDQLRAFWGYQSGSGYESILLDEDED